MNKMPDQSITSIPPISRQDSAKRKSNRPSAYYASGEFQETTFQDVDSIKNPFESYAYREKRLANRQRLGPDLYDEIKRIKTVDHFIEPIGQGGENIVFEIAKDEKIKNIRSVVIKVNALQTLRYTEALLENPNPADQERIHDQLERDIRHTTENILELKKYFGWHAIPDQKIILKNIPVSKQAAHIFFGRDVLPFKRFPMTVLAWITIQKKIEVMKEDDIGIRAYYPEVSERWNVHTEEHIARQKYIEMHNALTGRYTTPPGREIISTILEMYPDLVELYTTIETDPDAKKAIVDFTKRAIEYTNDTGKMFDFAGRGNIFLSRQGDEWKLKMPDPSLPDAGAHADELRTIISRLQSDEPFAINDGSRALNILNSVRITNALAVLCDIPERVMIHELKYIQPLRWLDELQQSFNEQRDIPPSRRLGQEEKTRR